MDKSEDRIQADCFTWFNNTFPLLRGLLYHVPNGGTRNKMEAMKFKAMGVVAGIPDIVFHYKGKTYFFEFKKNEKEKPRDSQRKIHEILDIHKFDVWVVWTQESFEKIINSIIDFDSERVTLGLRRSEYEYKTKVFNYLYEMKAGEIISIEEITTEDTRKKFVNYVAEFITEGYADLENFELLFTANFKHFYKIDETVDRTSLTNKYSVSQWRQKQRDNQKKSQQEKA